MIESIAETLKVERLPKAFYDALTPLAAEILENRVIVGSPVENVFYVTDSGSHVEYLGMQVRGQLLKRHWVKFAKIINYLAEERKIDGVLSVPFQISLPPDEDGKPRAAFFVYLSTLYSRDYLNALIGGENFTPEGGLPPNKWPKLVI